MLKHLSHAISCDGKFDAFKFMINYVTIIANGLISIVIYTMN